MQRNFGVIQKFWQYVGANGVVVKQREIAISGKYIENNVYAYIARQVLGDSSFYEIANSLDPVIDSVKNVISRKTKT
jgi:hypothetical protein